MSHNVRERAFGHVHSEKIQISSRICANWSDSSLTRRILDSRVKFLHADNEDWSDSADVQADLSHR